MEEYVHTQRLVYAEIRKKAAEEIVRAAVRRKIKSDIAAGNMEALPVVVKLAVQELGVEHFMSETRGRPKKQVTGRVFVTLESRNDKEVDPIMFVMAMQRLVKKRVLQGKGRFKLEQRSESAEVKPYGWHIHWDLQIDVPVALSIFLQQIYQSKMKEYLRPPQLGQDGKMTYPGVDVKVYEDRHDKYMLGEKVEEKRAKVARDAEIREQLKVPHMIVY